MSRISKRAQAGIAAFALPLLMSSAVLTFEMNGNPDGVRGGGPCSEVSEPGLPRQTRPGVPGVSPALSDVLGRGSSHRNRNNAGELHWIYSEGYQTNYPNTGSGLAVQSLIITAAGTAAIYTDIITAAGDCGYIHRRHGDVRASVLRFSSPMELHISCPLRRAVILAISLPIRTTS